MTLPAGLASIASQWDDSPHARGAVALCQALAERREAKARPAAVPDRMIADHAVLAVGTPRPERQDRYGAFSCSG